MTKEPPIEILFCKTPRDGDDPRRLYHDACRQAEIRL
jgi:hypothetical protein